MCWEYPVLENWIGIGIAGRIQSGRARRLVTKANAPGWDGCEFAGAGSAGRWYSGCGCEGWSWSAIAVKAGIRTRELR